MIWPIDDDCMHEMIAKPVTIDSTIDTARLRLYRAGWAVAKASLRPDILDEWA
jgi:hypothetical protein